MSIRVKLLLIMIFGVLIALGVSVLAFYNAATLDSRIDQVLSQELATMRVVSETRSALMETRQQEELVIALRDPALMIGVERSLADLVSAVQQGANHPEGSAAVAMWGHVSRLCDDYGALLAVLEEVLVVQGGELSLLRARLRDELSLMDGRMQRIGVSLASGDEGRAREIQQRVLHQVLPSFLQPPPWVSQRDGARVGHAVDVLSRVERGRWLVGSLLEWVRSSDQRDYRLGWVEGQQIEHLLRALVRESEALVSHWGGGAAPLGPSLLGSAEALAEMGTRFLTEHQAYESDIARLSRGAAVLRVRMEADLDAITRSAWQEVERRRAGIAQQRSKSFSVILLLLVVGVAIAMVLSAIMMRNMSKSFGQLLEAAHDIQHGHLDARVRITSRDELRELGSAFNAMAQYLLDRRRQQVDYNEIVSLLNSTLGIDAILSGSLQEIVCRSGSAVGAFYMADPDEQNLHLAKGHGLSTAMAERLNIKLGVGLVGQAAKTRRKILVSPVPEGIFDIDIGLGRMRPGALLVLPVVHVDRLLGVFVLLNAMPYAEETLTFIEEVVFQFGVALNNARFVAEIEATAEVLKERTEELIRQRARLEKVNRELETANRLKSDFLANVTHELRTPLNAIIGFTELVLEKGEQRGEKAKRHLETVLRNARSLLGLINDLLDITKIEAGRETLTLGEVKVRRLLDECLQTITPMVRSAPIVLQVEVEAAVATIYSDGSKLKQILINLLSNAAKFTDEGTISVVASAPRPGWVRFAVRDSGIGIHADDLPLIFDKFRQVDGSSSRKYGGTGLGLSITFELVKLFGGSIEATSQPGEGSLFTVDLPATAEELDPRLHQRVEVLTRDTRPTHASLPAVVPALVVPASPEAQRADGVAEDERDEGKSGVGMVVVLDDQPETVIVLREVLRNKGLEVKSAFVYSDARQMVESAEVALLVLGRSLPEPDGVTAEALLFEAVAAAQVPVILVGRDESPAELQVVLRLPRPFPPEMVSEAVEGTGPLAAVLAG